MSLPTIDQNLHFLRQGAELLERLDEETYRGPAGDRTAAGVGPHFRHVIDFYRCYLDGLADGRIDYDRRRRDPRLERSQRTAAAAFAGIADELSALEPADGDRRVEVRGDLAPGEDPEAAWCGSTLGRELRALVSHTVHHYALIALLLRGRGVDPGEEFGVAPATLEHWERAGAR